MNMGNSFGDFNLFDQSMNHLFNARSTYPSGINSPANDDSSDEDSSSSSESEEETIQREDSNSCTSQRESYCFDNVRFCLDIDKVTPQVVESVVEPLLSINELISLVFLLFDSRNALQVIITLIAAGPEFFYRGKISEWARSQPNNWQGMLLEALTLIQNYQILKKLGYKKEDIKTRFQPSHNVTLYISRVKKMLYRMMECLTAHDVSELFQFNEKFQSTYDPEYKYMEFHVLFWVDQGHINIDGSILKLDKLISRLEKFHTPFFKNMVTELTGLVEETNNSYPIIDPNEVGLLIIINMEKFYRERNLEWKHLLPEEDLNRRDGSKSDVLSLANTFKQMNFKVVEGHDIPHFEFEQMICKYVRENFLKKHSMLVLCVLSHGDEGRVYAANSIPLTVREIQNIVSELPQISVLLANKPKVIIVQACQGLKKLIVEPQKEMDNAASKKIDNDLHLDGGSQLTFDGPEKFFPKYGDVLLCMAIIEGYSAVRCPQKGSIYIQELCKCIRKFYLKEHFLDIVTRVHKKLNEKPLHVRNQPKGNCREHSNCLCIYMTPIEYSTFTKKLFLVASN